MYDLFIVGGGINGCGIAADAAGRGLSVYLCEKDDLTSHTSSASSKMIHGGLRYLENYEFRLVREALAEREVLLKAAPHLIQPLTLVIPHNKLLRPTWMIRIGLFLYDHLGRYFGKKMTLSKSKSIELNDDNYFGTPLRRELHKGFIYSDCKVDDARLVIANALAARQHGASIHTHTELIKAQRVNDHWQCIVKQNSKEMIVQARALINAAGPWVDSVDHLSSVKTQHTLDLIKGSHIVVKSLYRGNHAYLLQNIDKRVIFVIPYHTDFTMIGTTDIPYHGDPNDVKIDADERQYLCDAVNRYFQTPITPTDIVNEWSGVRPLQADAAKNPSAVTRDYHIEIHDQQGTAPIVSIFGGKITTYRQLAQHTLQKLMPYFSQMGKDWTADAPLPGGDFTEGLNDFTKNLMREYRWLPLNLAIRYAANYGTLARKLLGGTSKVSDLGEEVGHGLHAKEIDYLTRYEWATSVDDILWRRTKLGLCFTPDQIQQLSNQLQKAS